MCFNPVRAFKDIAGQLNPDTPLTNANGDQLSYVDQLLLNLKTEANPALKSQMLMNWLIGPTPKKVNPGENFAESEKMAGVIAKADAGRGMSGLFGMGLLVGESAPNLNLPVGQPGKDPSPMPIPDLTPQTGTGFMDPRQSAPNRGPGDGGKK